MREEGRPLTLVPFASLPPVATGWTSIDLLCGELLGDTANVSKERVGGHRRVAGTCLGASFSGSEKPGTNSKGCTLRGTSLMEGGRDQEKRLLSFLS